MKFTIRMDAVHVVIERPFGLSGPALELQADNYQLTIDAEQLIKGVLDLGKIVESKMKADDAAFTEMMASFKPVVDPNADVPQ